MYPKWDFRSSVKHSPETAWRSALREPFEELIGCWINSNRPADLFHVFEKGIYEGIIRRRWPFRELSLVEPTPEFYPCVLKGLSAVWLSLEFALEGDRVYIDCFDHPSSQLTDQQKENILVSLREKFLTTIEGRQVGVFPSKRAREIYQRIFWLQTYLKPTGRQ